MSDESKEPLVEVVPEGDSPADAANDELAAAIAAQAVRDSEATDNDAPPKDGDEEGVDGEDPVEQPAPRKGPSRSEIKAAATDAGTLAKRLKRAGKKLHRKHESFKGFSDIIAAVQVVENFVNSAHGEARRRGKALSQEPKSLDRYTVPQLKGMAEELKIVVKSKPAKAALIIQIENKCKEMGIDHPIL